MKVIILILIVSILGGDAASRKYPRPGLGSYRNIVHNINPTNEDGYDVRYNQDATSLLEIAKDEYGAHLLDDPSTDWEDVCLCGSFKKIQHDTEKPLMTWTGNRMTCNQKELRKCKNFCRAMDGAVRNDYPDKLCMNLVAHLDHGDNCNPFEEVCDPISESKDSFLNAVPRVRVELGKTDVFYKACDKNWEYAGPASLIDICCFQGTEVACKRSNRVRRPKYPLHVKY